MDKRFCTNCGNPLDGEHRFCGKCGHPLEEGQTAPPGPGTAQPQQAAASAHQPAVDAKPAADTSSEPVLGIIPNLQRRKGLLSFEAFNLVVTPRRLVFAAMTAEMLRQAAKEAAEASKAQLAGRDQQDPVDQDQGRRRRRRQLARRNPDQRHRGAARVPPEGP